ncbi:hypothetical protein AB0C42_32380 [Micromonospora taraxaci]|uniref:hypothetical protein n=1 Tax=Micromonospora taraxaci TaxID=1316803 RepID=UPI0033E9D627
MRSKKALTAGNASALNFGPITLLYTQTFSSASALAWLAISGVRFCCMSSTSRSSRWVCAESLAGGGGRMWVRSTCCAVVNGWASSTACAWNAARALVVNKHSAKMDFCNDFIGSCPGSQREGGTACIFGEACDDEMTVSWRIDDGRPMICDRGAKSPARH